jgi:hypothetical protein
MLIRRIEKRLRALDDRLHAPRAPALPTPRLQARGR